MSGWTWLLYETILETRGLTSFFAQSAHIITGWFPENSYPLISLGHLHLNAICQQSGNCPIMIYQFKYCAKVKKYCILATNIMCDYRSGWIPLNLCVMAKRIEKNGPNSRLSWSHSVIQFLQKCVRLRGKPLGSIWAIQTFGIEIF